MLSQNEHQLPDKFDFILILFGCLIGWFSRIGKIEEHGWIQIQFFLSFAKSFIKGANLDGAIILEHTLVELVRGEFSDLWIHPVLDLKHVVFHACV